MRFPSLSFLTGLLNLGTVDIGGSMKFAEYGLLGALLVPTAALATSLLITFSAPSEMPAQPGINPTSLATYYADLELQP